LLKNLDELNVTNDQMKNVARELEKVWSTYGREGIEYVNDAFRGTAGYVGSNDLVDMIGDVDDEVGNRSSKIKSLKILQLSGFTIPDSALPKGVNLEETKSIKIKETDLDQVIIEETRNYFIDLEDDKQLIKEYLQTLSEQDIEKIFEQELKEIAGLGALAKMAGKGIAKGSKAVGRGALKYGKQVGGDIATQTGQDLKSQALNYGMGALSALSGGEDEEGDTWSAKLGNIGATAGGLAGDVAGGVAGTAIAPGVGTVAGGVAGAVSSGLRDTSIGDVEAQEGGFYGEEGVAGTSTGLSPELARFVGSAAGRTAAQFTAQNLAPSPTGRQAQPPSGQVSTPPPMGDATTTGQPAPGSSALAQALRAGSPVIGGGGEQTTGRPVWNIASLRVKDETGS
jgi:hypothetical protein